MTIDRWTEIRATAATTVTLHSDDEPEPAVLPLEIDDPQHVEPSWARYVAGVVAEMHPSAGFAGTITTDIPIGAGLSSSAALELAVALALGFDGDALSLAQLCRRAEIRASGVPCGIMDQLVIAAGVAGHALLIDCGDVTIEPVKLPDEVDIVVRFVAHRALVGSAYARPRRGVRDGRIVDRPAARRRSGRHVADCRSSDPRQSAARRQRKSARARLRRGTPSR